MTYKVYIKKFTEMLDADIQQWELLFSECFGTNRYNSKKIWEIKYKNNSGFLGLLKIGDKLHASYSVILDKFDRPIGLSVDTMSDGIVQHATSKICAELYPFLKLNNINFLLGFPNDNIFKIREKYLGWKLGGDLYFKIKFGKLRSNRQRSSFELNRPFPLIFRKGMFFKLGYLLHKLGIIHLIAFNNPLLIVGKKSMITKKWCYVVLKSNFRVKELDLSINSIDVP